MKFALTPVWYCWLTVMFVKYTSIGWWSWVNMPGLVNPCEPCNRIFGEIWTRCSQEKDWCICSRYAENMVLFKRILFNVLAYGTLVMVVWVWNIYLLMAWEASLVNRVRYCETQLVGGLIRLICFWWFLEIYFQVLPLWWVATFLVWC